MIFYRLTHEQAKRAQVSLWVGVPPVLLIANMLKGSHGTAFVYGFGALMTVLYALIFWQISISERLNRLEQEATVGPDWPPAPGAPELPRR